MTVPAQPEQPLRQPAVLMTDPIAAIRAEFERTTHPEWRDVHPTGVLLAAIASRDAEIQQLRAQLDAVNLRETRMNLQALRHSLSGSANQLTDLIRAAGLAAGPLDRARREAAMWQARWQSTVVEARRQAARADTAELSLVHAMAWAHGAIYHHGGPACPYPDTCPATAPTT